MEERKVSKSKKVVRVLAGLFLVLGGVVGVPLLRDTPPSEGCAKYVHTHVKSLNLDGGTADPVTDQDVEFRMVPWCEVVPDTLSTCVARLDVTSMGLTGVPRNLEGRWATLTVITWSSPVPDTVTLEGPLLNKTLRFRASPCYLLEGRTKVWLSAPGITLPGEDLRLNMGGLCIEANIIGTRPAGGGSGGEGPSKPTIATSDSVAVTHGIIRGS